MVLGAQLRRVLASGPRNASRSGTAVCLLALIAVLFAVPEAGAQFGFDLWTSDNGLPYNIIYKVQQTPNGYLWLATMDGLVRFDGVRFTVYDRSNSPGIVTNRFTALYLQRNGDLWLGTDGGGVTRYRHGTFTSYTAREGIPDTFIRSITGDEAGHVWVLSGGLIFQWQEASGRFERVSVPGGGSGFFDTLLWEEGGFWSFHHDDLRLFVKGRFVTYPLPQWLKDSKVLAVAIDQDGAVWIETTDGRQARIEDSRVEALAEDASGYASGLASGAGATTTYRDKKANPWIIHVGRRLTRSIDVSSSVNVPFYALQEDGEGNLWLGTQGQGLYRVRRQFIHVYSRQDGLVDKNIYPIYQDREGAVWVGAWTGGLSRLQGGRVTSYTEPIGASKLYTALGEDSDGRLLAATFGGIQVLQDGKFVDRDGLTLAHGDVVSAILTDRRRVLWLGTSHGLVRCFAGVSTRYGVQDGLAGENIHVIVEGGPGELWIGGFGGLTLMKDGVFQHWTTRDGLPSDTVRALYYDGDGVLWIGTYDGGLARYKDGRFTRYSRRDGLFANGVFQILEDGRGNFWMSSNRGIYRVSKAQLNEFAAGQRGAITSVSYGKIDGMLNVECNGGAWPAGIKARDGTMWFPTQDGIAVFDPARAPTNAQPPPVVIESVLVDRAPVALNGPWKIPPGKDNFEIQYTALSFIKPEQMRFEYQLQGLDSNWVDAGARRTAYYSHVPPGRYTFRVIASNSDGVWNTEGESVSITVMAPFYLTWWFEALAFCCIGLTAWTAWRYRAGQLERAQAVQRAFALQLIASQEDERKRIAGELHDSIGQRLVIVKNLALFSLRDRRRSGLDQGPPHRPDSSPNGNGLGDGLVQAMEEISSETSMAIDETREMSYKLRPFQLDRLGLSKAVEIMVRQASTASAVQFTVEIDNIDDAFRVELRINFYRVVQESLNNIMKHAGATTAEVLVRRTPGRIVLTIRDNGRGFAPGAQVPPFENAGFGLTGMAERATVLGGVLRVESWPGHGTLLTGDFRLEEDFHARTT